MLDLQFVCDNRAAVEENCRNRGVPLDLSPLVSLADRRRQIIFEGDQLRHEQKDLSAQIPKAPAADKPGLIAKGKELFTGKATCFTCHGNEGRGDGPAGAALDPTPRNFHNPKFPTVKTEGEMRWVIMNGSPGTGMISYVPGIISEEEMQLIITWERSLANVP